MLDKKKQNLCDSFLDDLFVCFFKKAVTCCCLLTAQFLFVVITMSSCSKICFFFTCFFQIFHFSFLIIETFLYGTKISDKKNKGEKRARVVYVLNFVGIMVTFKFFFLSIFRFLLVSSFQKCVCC